MYPKKGIRFDFWSLVSLISLVTFGLFLIIPVGQMILYAFQNKEGAVTLDNFIKFFSRPYYIKSMTNSLSVVLSATVLVIAIGVPLAYISSTFKIKGKRFVDILIIISMLSPPFWVLTRGF